MDKLAVFPNAKLVIVATKKEASESSISLFRLSSYQVPCQKCIKATPRRNLKTSDLRKLCAKHFVVIYSNYPKQFLENKKKWK